MKMGIGMPWTQAGEGSRDKGIPNEMGVELINRIVVTFDVKYPHNALSVGPGWGVSKSLSLSAF